MRTVMIGVAVVLIAALGVGLYYVNLLSDMGAFSTVEPHFEGTCERLDGFAGGTEDLLIDRDTGWVFVSAFDRRAAEDPGADVRGAIEAFRVDASGAGIISITPQSPADFRPHGISLYDGPEGKRLFVINHPADGRQVIEVFDLRYWADGRPALAHVESITDPLIVSPNDLVAVGPRSFYVGNDFSTGERESLGFMLEAYLRLNRTTLVYFDGEAAEVAARGLTMANGVNVSSDGATLYLAETSDGTLRIYDRDVETGALTLRSGEGGILRLGPGLDNIDIDEAGRIWIAGHPQLFKLLDSMEDPASLSPAQVFMLTPEGGEGSEGGTVAEVYLGDGSLASGSATAVYHDGTMLIGVVFDPHVVVCRPTNEHVVGG